MRRDILFFVKGIPQDSLVRDAHYFLAPVSGNANQLVDQLHERFPGFDGFMRMRPELPVMAFGIRLEIEDLKEALSIAHRQVSGLIDGYSLLTDDPPSLADAVLVRNGDEEHAEIRQYKKGGWVTSEDKGSSARNQWDGRNAQLLAQLLQFFDVVTHDPKTPPTELRTNLLYALRMYREGGASGSAGIEYLAKFSALECIVCGSATHGKEQLLTTRLTALFEDPEIINAERMGRLWQLRCSASHQARAYPDIEEDESYPPGVGTIYVERLMAGAVYFALENGYQVDTVDELWDLAQSYILPELIIEHRPQGLTRISVESMIIDPKLRAVGAGPLFDRLYPETKRS